ncbi:MAG: DEAD/DEAH box helicase [Geobacter sp.]|nr:DEAD/DEAH box helicase [Geobacter sp.]
MNRGTGRGTKRTVAGGRSTKTVEAVAVTPKVSRTHLPDGMNLEEWQRLLRTQFGEKQAFILTNTGDHPVFSDFSLHNPSTGKSYRLAIRGDRPGENFCSCPTYRINGLGTCKHIEFALARLKEKRGAKRLFGAGYFPSYSEVYLSYGLKREIRFRAGVGAPSALLSLARRFFDDNGVLKERRLLDFPTFLDGVHRDDGHELRCYDDVMSFVAEHQDAAHRRAVVDTELAGGIESPVFDTLLKAVLYPYQREGALFAVRAGRCLVGDDMGLGKTVQAIAAAELMARLFGVTKVLVVSPTSLKYQWKGEIEAFTDRTVTVIEGLNDQRRAIYRDDAFFKLVNYELIHRDMPMIREWGPDLVIVDEAQRIKNWQTRTAKCIKELDSPFAIVLTGTPIENRIEELHSIMEFVDRHHLGPLYRFVHTHRVTDGGGRVVGYRNLEKVRQSLKGVMIRRKKDEVLRQLPGRIDKNFFVPLTPEQWEIHDEHRENVAKLVAKWRRYKFLCEADQKRLQVALATMRMAADNTYLVDRKTVSGPKIDELETLLKELVVEGSEKVVIFSQWLRMTELVEGVLTRNGIGYAHLNGSVPSKERKGLMVRFKEDPACRVFLSTDAGGVGLNLQSGSVVINMDIPWNPAILEQRIARVHRMGQKRPVRVVNFVSRASIEERILDLLRFKKSLFAGALDDGGADVVMMGESQLEGFMKSVEEVSGGIERPDPAVEQSERLEEAHDVCTAEAEERAEEQMEPAEPAMVGGGDALAGLLASGAEFLQNLSRLVAGAGPSADAASGRPARPVENVLAGMISRDEATGKNCLKIPLPEPEVLTTLLSGFGQLLAGVMTGRNGA